MNIPLVKNYPMYTCVKALIELVCLNRTFTNKIYSQTTVRGPISDCDSNSSLRRRLKSARWMLHARFLLYGLKKMLISNERLYRIMSSADDF